MSNHLFNNAHTEPTKLPLDFDPAAFALVMEDGTELPATMWGPRSVSFEPPVNSRALSVTYKGNPLVEFAREGPYIGTGDPLTIEIIA